jgi:hypothetical protein
MISWFGTCQKELTPPPDPAVRSPMQTGPIRTHRYRLPSESRRCRTTRRSSGPDPESAGVRAIRNRLGRPGACRTLHRCAQRETLKDQGSVLNHNPSRAVAPARAWRIMVRFRTQTLQPVTRIQRVKTCARSRPAPCRSGMPTTSTLPPGVRGGWCGARQGAPCSPRWEWGDWRAPGVRPPHPGTHGARFDRREVRKEFARRAWLGRTRLQEVTSSHARGLSFGLRAVREGRLPVPGAPRPCAASESGCPEKSGKIHPAGPPRNPIPFVREQGQEGRERATSAQLRDRTTETSGLFPRPGTIGVRHHARPPTHESRQAPAPAHPRSSEVR